MLTISQRGQQMPASPIRKLVPFAEAAKKKGIRVFHLNIGQPDIETPPPILDAVKNTDIKVLEYSHSAGNESYRRKLVQYYKKVGIDVTHNQILVTTGGSEAIMFGFFSCLNPGDEVIIPEPFYANYNGFACAAGVKVIPAFVEENFSAVNSVFKQSYDHAKKHIQEGVNVIQESILGIYDKASSYVHKMALPVNNFIKDLTQIEAEFQAEIRGKSVGMTTASCIIPLEEALKGRMEENY